MIDIFIPTFGRYQRLVDLYRQIKSVSKVPTEIYFIIEQTDIHSHKTCLYNDIPFIFNELEPSYAGAINTAYKKTNSEYFFCGGDDLNFHDGWDLACLSKMSQKIMVVGTNDLLNRDVLTGNHATHYLVKREYIKKFGGVIDDDSHELVLFPYHHNYVDWEFVKTAQMRGVFSPCLESIVEHCHYGNKKAEFDETYKKNQSTLKLDKNIYNQRKHLWKE